LLASPFLAACRRRPLNRLPASPQGRVIESGPPAQLAAKPKGVYATMLRVMHEAQRCQG
jgi:hypothetical protein